MSQAQFPQPADGREHPRDEVQSEQDLLEQQRAFFSGDMKPAATVVRKTRQKSAVASINADAMPPLLAADSDDDDDNSNSKQGAATLLQPSEEADAKDLRTATTTTHSPDQLPQAASMLKKRGKSLFAQRQAALLERVRGSDDMLDDGTATQPQAKLLSEVQERPKLPGTLSMPPRVVQHSTITGFPEPERLARNIAPLHHRLPTPGSAYSAIDRDNRVQLESMPEDEIVDAQHDLHERLGPSGVSWLLDRLAKRQQNSSSGAEATREYEASIEHALARPLSSMEEPAEDATPLEEAPAHVIGQIDAEGTKLYATPNASTSPTKPRESSTKPDCEATQRVDDDPVAMRTRYFADVPLEPAKLAWMGLDLKDITESGDSPLADRSNASSSAAGAAAATRYDLRGHSVAPTADIPTHHGLHHHGKEQDRAGYTIEELLLLARSSVAAQRATAWRILSHVLWRAHELHRAATAQDRSCLEANEVAVRFAELSGPLYLTLGLDETHASVIAGVVDALAAWTDHTSSSSSHTDISDVPENAPRARNDLNAAGRLRVLAALDVVPRLRYVLRTGLAAPSTVAHVERILALFPAPTANAATPAE